MLQGLLELIDRDPSSPLIHADAEREAVSYGRLLNDVRACTSGLGQLDPCDAGTAWVSVHDPYLLLVAVLGALGRASCALAEPGSSALDCERMAAAGAPDVVICDDPEDPVCGWARARGVPVAGVDLTAAGGAAPPPGEGPERHLRFFTSGSTGVPKCIGLGLPQLRTALAGVARTIRLGPEDVSLSTASLSHTLGLITTVLVAWASGGTVVFADLNRPRQLETALAGARPTWCAASPALLRLLLRLAAARRMAWPSLRLLRSASSPLPLELLRDLEAGFEVPVINAYVMTEAPGEIASQGLDDDRRPGTVGRPTVCEVEIRNAGAAGVDASGEVWIRGPNVAATADPSGWLRTGDMGRRDESGVLTITGRRDDIINQGGIKVWPPDVEAAALEHPGIRAAVAFPIPHRGLGEVVGLVVEPRLGAELDRAAIRTFLMARLARSRWPSTIVVCDSIPLNRRGKIPRRHMARLLSDRL